MTRHKASSPVSLFSFQDIIMSVVGIVLLITLILVLQLVSRMSAAPMPTLSVQEIEQQIESLKPVLVDLQDSVAELHQVREASEIFIPAPDQIDALQSNVDRLEANAATIESNIKDTAKIVTELKNSPVIQSLAAVEQAVQDLVKRRDGIKKQSQDSQQDTAELQAAILKLKAENVRLDQQLSKQTVPLLKVSVPKDSTKISFILLYGQGMIKIIPTDGSSGQTFSSKEQFFIWAGRHNPDSVHFVMYLRPSRFGYHDEIIKDLRVRGFAVGLQVIGETTDLSLSP